MNKLHLKNSLKLLIVMFVILLNNIKIKGCLCGFRDRCKGAVFCDNFIKLSKDDSKYKEIIEFIKNPQNYREKVGTADKFLHYKPLDIDINIEITEEEIKDIIDNEIDNIKNRTINVKKETVGEGNVNKLGKLKFIYVIENDEIIPVKAGTFYFEDYYNTKHGYDRYKKTYIDYWYDKYLKKEVYSFDNLKKFWNENKPDYLYCDEYKYPVFLFKKNEKNKQLFEKEEEKHKHCSGFS